MPLREEGVFTWDTLYGKEYALASIHLILEEFLREIREATERLGQIFAKTVEVVQSSSDDLLNELGIPPAAWSAVRLPFRPDWPTVIGRFDFASTPEGLKMLEFNSDTPTGVVEAFYINGKVCDVYGKVDPNRDAHLDLRDAFQKTLDRFKKEGLPTERIVFSSLGWHEEDAGTVRYLLSQSGLSGRFVPLDQLSVRGVSLCAPSDAGSEPEPVDVWYRLHPIEILAEDSDDQGYPTGAHLLQIIAMKKLAVINPPKALISQSKAMQALIWKLAESGAFYAPEEREAIQRWMLPTDVQNRFSGTGPYVEKPFFGREGGAVTLVGEDGNPIASAPDPDYGQQPMVYQQLAELERIEVETAAGAFTGKLLWGSFLIGGKASAIMARVDKEITGNDSYFLPVGLAG